MVLLIIVAALLTDFYARWPQGLRDFGWYQHHIEWLSGRFAARAVWGLLLALALPVAVTLVAQAATTHGAGLVLGTLFAWLVLLYCLGADNLAKQLNDYLEAVESQDTVRAAAIREQLETETDEEHDPFVTGIVARAHEQVFAVLFWFALLGPVGAVLYRFARCLAEAQSGVDESVKAAAVHLLGVLGWPSARLMAFCFALMGNFDKALFRLSAGVVWQPDVNTGNRGLLASVADAAIDLTDSNLDEYDSARRVRGLVLRTLGVWLAALALLTLSGW